MFMQKKWKIESLSALPLCQWKDAECTKHFWRFTAKQHLTNNWSTRGCKKKQRQQPKKQNMKWLHTDPPTRSPEISNGCESLLLQSPNLHQCWNPGASRDSRCLESQFIFHFFFIFLVVFLCFKTPIDSSCFGECCEAHLLQLQPTFYQHEGFFGWTCPLKSEEMLQSQTVRFSGQSGYISSPFSEHFKVRLFNILSF